MIRTYSRHSRRQGRSAHKMPEITLTPLIDTSLTILVIFMITAPALQNSIRVDLPHGQHQEAKKENTEVCVSIDKDEQIYINDIKVSFAELSEKLAALLPAHQKVVRLNGDRFLSYNIIMTVMDKIKQLNKVEYVVLSTQAN